MVGAIKKRGFESERVEDKMAEECGPLLRGTCGEAYSLIRETKTILLEQHLSLLTPTDGKYMDCVFFHCCELHSFVWD